MKLFDRIAQKLNIKTENAAGCMTNPINGVNEDSAKEFLSKLSKHAVNLYEKQCDIKNFTRLALSDPENTSHNKMVAELFEQGVLDPLSDDIIERLASNPELLSDLDLDM